LLVFRYTDESMDLKELRSLLALADNSSIRKAAERVNLSPAAVHRHLKLLSDELGVKLYDGTRRHLHLTPAGSALCPMARNLLEQFEAIRSSADDWKDIRKGTVRIGTGPTFGTYVLPRMLERYRETYPEVEMFVLAGHTETLMEELRVGHLDVIFLIVPEGALDGLVVHSVWQFRMVLVASKRLAIPRRCSLTDLRHTPFLLYKQGTRFESLIDGYFERNRFAPRVTMRFDNAEPIKAMVRLGFGVSMLPEWTVREDLKRGEIVRIEQREDPLILKHGVLKRRDTFQRPPVKVFLEMAKSWKAWRE
jgi:DNA-binding transcriptional LysR family regulator